MDDLEAEDCGCPFGKIRTKAQGHQDDQPGKESCHHRKDAQQCIGCCLDRFLNRLSPGYNSSSLPAVCTSLSGSAASRALWNLYWCDSRYCGVWIDSNKGKGQDPNVDLIINKCQNIGRPSVIDPGPPPPDYACSHLTAQQSTLVACQEDIVSSTSAGTRTASTTQIQLQTATHSSVTATPTPEISGSASTTSMPPGEAQPTDLSAGVKATIGLCSALGLFFLLCLALVCWRRAHDRRRTEQTGDLKAHIRHHHGRLPSHSRDSPTPLIAPNHSTPGSLTPLTPPLRLRDRKLLPSILKPMGRSSSPPLTSLSPPRSPAHAGRGDQFSFPGSPICKPTTSKLVPRHEQATKFYGLPMPPSTASTGPRSSISSCAASGSTTANSSLRHEIEAIASYAITSSGAAATTTANSSSSVPTPPSSPTRPQRPHEEALHIPDLVTPAPPSAPPLAPPTLPAGPPPKRALPVPPISPTSPTSSGPPGQTVSELNDESHDIRELTKEYAREHRESWSSWTTGGGGPGVTVSPTRGKSGTGGTFKLKTLLPEVRRAAASIDSTTPTSPPPLLHEDDLASLGGRY